MNLPKPPQKKDTPSSATNALWTEYWSTCKDILILENQQLKKALKKANKIIEKIIELKKL